MHELNPHSTTATASLEALMTALIDYAGLFPPANLPLPDAIANYARYRQEPDRWMLSRFVIPAPQLSELSQIAGDQFSSADPFTYAVLGRGGNDFLASLRNDLQAVRDFRQAHASKIVADVLEIRIPPHDPVKPLLYAANDQITETGGLMVFYEAPHGENWQDTARSLIEAIADLRQQGVAAGFKLRTGGVEATAFPTPAQIAFAIVACRDAMIPMKATAGLHHPLRRFDSSVNTKMYGFLNVFSAGLLAHTNQLNEREIEEILIDEDPAHFVFTDAALMWQQYSISTEHIQQIRGQALISFGSCSFDEPREDLRALRLL